MRSLKLFPAQFFLPLLLVFGLLLFFRMSFVFAATITVDATTDDRISGDGLCEFSEAINNANEDANDGSGASNIDCAAGSGADDIEFNIGAGDAQVITISSDVPSVTSEVHVDGTTQPGITPATCSPRNLYISIDGNGLTQKVLYFLAGSSGSSVNGLNIYGTTIGAIDIATDTVTVTCNNIGTNLAGTGVAPNINQDTGIRFENGDSNIIGGNSEAERNIVSGNNFAGFWLTTGSENNVITGNYVGVDVNGTAAVPNGASGIALLDSDTNTIGGSGAGEGNLVSGNGQSGIFLQNADSNNFWGNYIGLDVTGTAAIANGFSGIAISDGDSNTIGGSAAGERNIISGNFNDGINVTMGDTNVIQGNYIGTDITGMVGVANGGKGVVIGGNPGDVDGNIIGGNRLLGEGNVISNNSFGGSAFTNTTNLVIKGNIFGLTQDGLTYLGNTNEGIADNDSISMTIGGTVAGEGNIISGNGLSGVHFSSTTLSTIQGNIVGLDSTGTAIIGNSGGGIILLNSDNNTIGGTAAGAGNLVSGNSNVGIDIEIGDSNTIQGNRVGTDITGTLDLGNTNRGIAVQNGTLNVIGGTTVAARNIIAGNDDTGIQLDYQATFTTVQGNWVGVDALGNPLGNGTFGIGIAGQNNTIGGNTAAEGNVFSTNGVAGVVFISGILGAPPFPTDNVLQGNYIGTDTTGVVSPGYGNLIGGVLIIFSAEDNLIGGTAAGEGNIIAGNGGFGIAVVSFPPIAPLPPVRNAILGNSIYDNASLGIDELSDTDGDFTPDENVGPNTNDPGDPDVGPNDYLNHPIIYSITPAGVGMVQVNYFLDVPAGNYRIEFFDNTTIDSSNHGEGETFIDFDPISHTGSGVEFFSIVIPALPGDIITATATEDLGLGTYGSTSEFSPTTLVSNTGVDFGDAPDSATGTGNSNYNTTAADHGAYHTIDGVLYLGACVDADLGNLQNATANADDNSVTAPASGVCAGGDDEDGVTFTTSLVAGNAASADVVSSAAGILNAWIDYTQDGDFDDAGEQVFTDTAVIAGTNTLPFAVPSGVFGGITFSRFRLSGTAGITPYDEVIGGEVEDYRVAVSGISGGNGSGGGGGGSGGVRRRSSGNPVPAPACTRSSSTPIPFTDITGYWARNYIVDLFIHCIVDGRTPTLFMPEDHATRAEFVKMVVRALKVPAAEYSYVFRDVSASDWFSPYVMAASKDGLIGGYPSLGLPEFRPNQSITRAEALKILLLAKGVDLGNYSSNFNDVSPTDWVYPYVSFATHFQIIEGYPNPANPNSRPFKPNDLITRAELSKVLDMVFNSTAY